MTTRDPLDLRGKTMTELMDWDANIGNTLDGKTEADNLYGLPFEVVQKWLLADRRQIREEMERRRDIEALGVPAEKLKPGNTYANLYDPR